MQKVYNLYLKQKFLYKGEQNNGRKARLLFY